MAEIEDLLNQFLSEYDAKESQAQKIDSGSSSSDKETLDLLNTFLNKPSSEEIATQNRTKARPEENVPGIMSNLPGALKQATMDYGETGFKAKQAYDIGAENLKNLREMADANDSKSYYDIKAKLDGNAFAREAAGLNAPRNIFEKIVTSTAEIAPYMPEMAKAVIQGVGKGYEKYGLKNFGGEAGAEGLQEFFKYTWDIAKGDVKNEVLDRIGNNRKVEDKDFELANKISNVAAVPYILADMIEASSFASFGLSLPILNKIKSTVLQKSIHWAAASAAESLAEGAQKITTETAAEINAYIKRSTFKNDIKKNALQIVADGYNEAINSFIPMATLSAGTMGGVALGKHFAGPVIKKMQRDSVLNSLSHSIYETDPTKIPASMEQKKLVITDSGMNKNKNFLLSPEGIAEFIQKSPYEAKTIAQKENPSRKDMIKIVNSRDQWSAEERKTFSVMVKEALTPKDVKNESKADTQGKEDAKGKDQGSVVEETEISKPPGGVREPPKEIVKPPVIPGPVIPPPEPKEEIVKPPEPPKEDPKKEELKKNETLSGKIKSELDTQGGLTKERLKELGDTHYGGTEAQGKYTSKDLYEELESAVNEHVMEKYSVDVDEESAQKNIKEISDMVSKLPTQTSRTDTKNELQQFSTPPDYAYAVAWAANVNKNDTVLEPSSGPGGLIASVMKTAKKVYANEWDKARGEKASRLGANVSNEDAELISKIFHGKISPDVVIMNPPFSRAGQRFLEGQKLPMTAANHIEEAMKLLKNNGRLIAIVGRGMGEETPTFKQWFQDMKSKYDLKANISVSGDIYKKYGTSFGTRVLVFDKTGPTKGESLKKSVNNASELITTLKGVRDERGITSERIDSKPDMPKGDGGSKPGSSGGDSIPSSGSGNSSGTSVTNGTGTRDKNNGSSNKPDVQSGTEKGNEADTGSSGRNEPGGGKSVDSGATSGEKPGGTGKSSDMDTIHESQGEESSTTQQPSGELKEDLKKEEVDPSNRKAEFTGSVFEPYTLTKVKFKGAHAHPASMVESAAMSVIELPDCDYIPKIDQKIIERGEVSELQLEAVAYFGQATSKYLPAPEGFEITKDGSKPFESRRRGFLLGDGTGSGKTRTILAAILDNWNRGGKRKAVFITENQSLQTGLAANWAALDGKESDIVNLKDLKGSKRDGILFTTYATIIKETEQKGGNDKKTRVQEIIDWLGKDFDGVIAYDESHNMKSAIDMKAAAGSQGGKKASQRSKSAQAIADALPHARVLYSSATAATEVENLAYADRLGLWGYGKSAATAQEFVQKVQAAGLAGMECIAQSLKAMGLYLSRNISYDDGTEKGTVKFRKLEYELTKSQTEAYDKMSEGWSIVFKNIQLALHQNGSGHNKNAKSNAIKQFNGAQLRFFESLMITMQTPAVIDDMRKQFDAGNACVIQLTSTKGEEIKDKIGEMDKDSDFDDFALSPMDMLLNYLDKSFPTQQYEDFSEMVNGKLVTGSRPAVDREGNPVQNPESVKLKEELMSQIGSMGKIFGADSPIDMILNAFGHERIAEVTGRSQRVIDIRQKDGTTKKELQKRGNKAGLSSPLEVKKFNDGEKDGLLFSYAGSTGGNYHASVDVKNQKKRIHYVLQPGWIADKAMQGLGRTHRSAQVSAPEYVLVTTNLRGQKRFITTIAKRLAQLGALTSGQRDTKGGGLFDDRDNLESAEAKAALKRTLDELRGKGINGFTAKDFENALGIKLINKEGAIEKKFEKTSYTLNRLMALKIRDQNKFFDRFEEIWTEEIEKAKSLGTLDKGMETYTADSIEKVKESLIFTDPDTGAKVHYASFLAKHKVKFIKWKNIVSEGLHGKPVSSYYKSIRGGKIYALAAPEYRQQSDGDLKKVVRATDQRDTRMVDAEKFDNVKEWTKITEDEAKAAWDEQIKTMPTFKTEEVHLVTGAIWPIWDRISGGFGMYRLITDKGERYLGRVVDNNSIADTMRNFGIGVTESIDPAQAIQKLIDREVKIHLSNKWVIKGSLHLKDSYIELIGPSYQDGKLLEKLGIFSKSIEYVTRYFIPLDKALKIYNELIRIHSISKIEYLKGAQNDVVHGLKSKGGTFIDSFEDLNNDDFFDKAYGKEVRKGTLKLFEASKELAKKYAKMIGAGYNVKNSIACFYPDSKNIFTQSLNNLSVAVHEITHFIDDKLGIRKEINRVVGQSSSGDPIYSSRHARLIQELTRIYTNYYPDGKKTHSRDMRVTEGIATFFQMFIESPVKISNEFPYLVNTFLDKGGEFYHQLPVNFIRDTRAIIRQYNALEPAQKIATRTWYGRKDVKKSNLTFLEKCREVLENSIFLLEKLSRSKGKFLGNQDPYSAAEFYGFLPQIIGTNVNSNKGYIGIVDDKGTFRTKYNFNYYTLVNDLKKEGYLETFDSWLISRIQFYEYAKLDELKDEAQEAMKVYRDYKQRLADGKCTQAEFDEKHIDAKTKVAAHAKQNRLLQNDNYSRKLIEQCYHLYKDKFKGFAEQFDKLNDENIYLLNHPTVQLLDDERKAELNKKRGYYASLKRFFDNEIIGDESSRYGSPKTNISYLIARKGSEKEVISPMHSAIMAHSETLRKAMKQIIYNRLYKTCSGEDSLNIFNRLDLKVKVEDGKITYPQEKDPNIIMARQAYKRRPLLIDSHLKEVLDDRLNPFNYGPFEKALLYFRRVFTQGVTSFSEKFILRNPLIDMLTAYSNSQTKYKPVWDQVKLFYNSLTDNTSEVGEFLKEYLIVAGARQTYAGMYSKTPQEFYESITREKNGLEKVMQLIEAGKDILTIPANASEIFNRACEYIKARQNGVDQYAAMEMAGRVSIPFHHQGSYGGSHFAKIWIESIPFAGARFKLLFQTMTTLQNKPTRKQFLTVFLAITAANIAAMWYLLQGSDDQKEKLKSKSPEELAAAIWIPHRNGVDLIRWPVGNEFSWFGTIVNMMISETMMNSSYSTKDYLTVGTSWVPQQLNPLDPQKMFLSLLPHVGTIGLMAAADLKLWPNPRSIYSKHELSLPENLRIRENTMPIAKYVGDLIGISPVKMDGLITTTFGPAFRTLSDILSLKWKPFKGAFVQEVYWDSSRQFLRFYDIRTDIFQKKQAIDDGKLELKGKEADEFDVKYRKVKEINSLLKIYHLLNDEKIKTGNVDPEYDTIRKDILSKIETLEG